MQQNTVNEYTLIQQSSVLFQENYQRNQNEQKLYMEWRAADNAWKIANSEIGQLKSMVNNLQQHIDELKSKTMRIDVAEPNEPATPISSSSSKEPDYQPDEEELAKETEWIRVKYKAKNECDTPTNNLR
jgi:seryl-tRNA synthetase